jgi:hypothetical protein
MMQMMMQEKLDHDDDHHVESTESMIDSSASLSTTHSNPITTSGTGIVSSLLLNPTSFLAYARLPKPFEHE